MQWQISGALMPKSLAEIDLTRMLEQFASELVYNTEHKVGVGYLVRIDEMVAVINTLIASGQREALTRLYDKIYKDIYKTGQEDVWKCLLQIESRLKELEGK